MLVYGLLLIEEFLLSKYVCCSLPFEEMGIMLC